MNPLTNVKNIQKLNKLELESGTGGKTSWHNQYKDSAWIFIGGLPYDLTEGDVLAVFSQYGEVVNINLVRDKATGKSKGFVFLCYEDQRSTILAVDNLNSSKILGRTLRVDHCENYRKPKETGEEDDLTQQVRALGCAPKTPSPVPSEDEDIIPVKKAKKDKTQKKKKEKKKKKDKKEKVIKTEIKSESEDSGDELQQSLVRFPPIRVKQEKIDPAYNKYAINDKYGRNREIKQETNNGSREKGGRNLGENYDPDHESERLADRRGERFDGSRSRKRDSSRERFQVDRTKYSRVDRIDRSDQDNFSSKRSRPNDHNRDFGQPRESDSRSRSNYSSDRPEGRGDKYNQDRRDRDHRLDRKTSPSHRYDDRDQRRNNYDDNYRR